MVFYVRRTGSSGSFMTSLLRHTLRHGKDIVTLRMSQTSVHSGHTERNRNLIYEFYHQFETSCLGACRLSVFHQSLSRQNPRLMCIFRM